MRFQKNMLIEWLSLDNHSNNKEEKKIERVLYFLQGNEYAVLIDTADRNAYPVLRSTDDMNLAYEVGDLRILSHDPVMEELLGIGEIQDKHKARQDQAWKCVELFLNETRQDLYKKKVWTKALKKVCKVTGKPPNVVREYVRRYLKSGRIKNSLLPRYAKCGGKGKKRISKESYGKKLGKPNALTLVTGNNYGFRVTLASQKLFEKGVEKHLKGNESISLFEVYQRTLREFFNIGYEEDIDGNQVPIIPSHDRRPSFDQFRYYYERYLKDPVEEDRAKYGETHHNLNNRSLYGDSTSMAMGPGSLYQIDATIGDIYLVSEFNRSKIIGRPVIYFVIDVFSRMIVGFSVTLEGPSWNGMRLALDNVVSDKVSLCAEYGITIEKEDWNCHSLPEALLGDRGELISKNADILTDILGIRVQNTGSYRADLKGIVERHFGIANEKFIKFTPGHVKKRNRGDKDYRLDATLSLYDFRKLIIYHILDYNQNHKLTWYRPDEFQVADDVPLRPICLWNWGIRNRSGILRSFPRDTVRYALLPKKYPLNTNYGLRFKKNIYYLPPPALKRGKRIEISYDASSLDYIYVRGSNGDAIPCPLTPASKLYEGKDYQDTRHYFIWDKQNEIVDTDRDYQSKAEFEAKRERTIVDANKKNALHNSHSDISKTAKVKGIKGNRTEEKEHERRENTWYIGGAEKPKQLPPAPNFQVDENEDYIPQPNYTKNIKQALRSQGEHEHE